MEMKEILASIEKSGDSVSEADEDHSDAPGQQKRKKITDGMLTLYSDDKKC